MLACATGAKLWDFWPRILGFVTAGLSAGALSMCYLVGPGHVPRYWGFHMGEDAKRKRYCKLCNIWRPERTHHCSICDTCCLNMDHHCPWLMCCIGFYNRKYFMQSLTWVGLLAMQVTGGAMVQLLRAQGHAWTRWCGGIPAHAAASVVVVPASCTLLKPIFNPFWGLLAPVAGLLCLYTSLIDKNTTRVAVMTYFWGSTFLFGCKDFYKFHLNLVLDNFTTIENLDREIGEKSKFDMGRLRNWEQVFGKNPWLWFIPIWHASARPVGDGVRWRMQHTQVISDNGEDPLPAPVPQGQAAAPDPQIRRTNPQPAPPQWLTRTLSRVIEDPRESLLAELFDLYDVDGNGVITKDEFTQVNSGLSSFELPSVHTEQTAEGTTFSIKIDPIPGQPLGVVIRQKDGVALEVRRIQTSGAVAAWNEAHPNENVQESDLMVEINGVCDNALKMMEEVRNWQKEGRALKITFLREAVEGRWHPQRTRSTIFAEMDTNSDMVVDRTEFVEYFHGYLWKRNAGLEEQMKILEDMINVRIRSDVRNAV